ncbi:hypothetical protein BA195_10200 [Tenacibaculum soleae]|uniref:Uncharacterized protein n=1 Tax=Tenacibaculum soleae TaxID=447689 RepID=A0A1B9XY89_9FLAO|nr:hypothetical protein [Tenacibaculum soleae]OCK42538.1 hypothetical protein BA195_10200 [Tenacibaculum soleae]
MDNINQQDIIKSEIEALIADIIKVYEASGKKVSGEFKKGLKAIYEEDKAIIQGYTYLAGRRAGKMPPIENIKRWIEQKGIQPFEKSMTTSSLAWAIAKNIAKKGTNSNYHLKIYEQVITPERIDKIIKKVSQFNVNNFLDEVSIELQLLEKNI